MKYKRTLKLVFLIISTVIFSSGLLASGLKKKKGNPMLESTILEVNTSESENFSYRAVLGKSKSKYYLKIEKFQRSKDFDGLGSLVETTNIQDIPGGKELKLADGWYISDLRWNASGLSFKNESASGSIIKTVNCEVSLFGKSPNVICK